MLGELNLMDPFKTDDAAAPAEVAARRFAIAVLNALESERIIALGDVALIRVGGGFKIERKINADR
jgi:hypothetical protein